VRLEDGIAVPKSYTFALSFPDELDELWADELYDLSEDLNSNNDGSDKKVWILKPALADKGQGIRLFRTKDELYAIFEQLEEDEESHNQSHSSDEEAGEEEDTSYHQKTWVPVSQMRDWIIQVYRYLPPIFFFFLLSMFVLTVLLSDALGIYIQSAPETSTCTRELRHPLSTRPLVVP
jgi:hypothetical protein